MQARGACPKTLKTAEPRDPVQARDCHWLQPLCGKQKQEGENLSPGLAKKIMPIPGCKTGSPSKASFAGWCPQESPSSGGGLSPSWSSKRAGAIPTSHQQGPHKVQCCSPSTDAGQGSPLGRLLSVGTWRGGVKSEQERAGAGRVQAGQRGRAAPSFLPVPTHRSPAAPRAG